MTLILTFLGKGGTGRSTVAIAAAQKLSAQGKRVLLISQEAGPALAMLLGAGGVGNNGAAVGFSPTVSSVPSPITLEGSSFEVMQLQTTDLIDDNWEKLKSIEAQYLRDPFFKAVYGQELSIIPGMDDFLALNAIREQTESNQYDVIVHDGTGNQASLRMWGAIGGVDWYFQRFKKVFQDSQFYRSISPFIAPITGAIMSGGMSGDIWNQPGSKGIEDMVAKGKSLVRDPMHLRAYVVTTADEIALAQGKYLWSAAQQIGLTVAGILINSLSPNQSTAASNLTGDLTGDLATATFSPLPTTALPYSLGDRRWQTLAQALPALTEPINVPRPMSVDASSSTVKLFLPGFDKTQVKLTQYGPEVTVQAGDQRHNLSLPPALNGRSVTGAKFQDGYLIISFG